MGKKLDPRDYAIFLSLKSQADFHSNNAVSAFNTAVLSVELVEKFTQQFSTAVGPQFEIYTRSREIYAQLFSLCDYFRERFNNEEFMSFLKREEMGIVGKLFIKETFKQCFYYSQQKNRLRRAFIIFHFSKSSCFYYFLKILTKFLLAFIIQFLRGVLIINCPVACRPWTRGFG